MNSKYNVLINYLGDGEFKFTIKKIGEIGITKDRPVYIYNADIETINNLRTLRRMLIEITIGGKPAGAYKIYNLDDYNKEKDMLYDRRIIVDRRGTGVVSNNEINSILSSGTNGPIVEDVAPVKTEEVKTTSTKKTTKKSTSKKTSKK